jgi:hypothetical protein
MAFGQHNLEYEVLEGWEQLPEGWSFVEVAGVAVDSQDRVYVFKPRQTSSHRLQQRKVNF